MRIVADPDDESACLAYAGDLRDNGHDAEALVVRTFWPALRDTLATGQTFDAIMADLRRHLWTLRDAALRVVEAMEKPPT
ncbi:MAG TPA: hypothetical protein VKD90_06010 [Gemmataceae bacterium]|nr:hypothetical protein [Gemmataceae bacterium]